MLSASHTPGAIDEWTEPPAALQLGADGVHVWRIDADRDRDDMQRLEGWLADDERARAQRFRFEIDRRRFIARRGLLREVLGRYLHLPAAALRYELGAFGKPRLSGALPIDLRFSVSHSAGLVLIAVARGREVGVDVERIVPERADSGVAARFFAPAERVVLAQFVGDAWTEGFFRCWTRKEAFVKACGEGLSFPLERFEVSLVPDEPARMVRVEGDEREALRWSMCALRPAPGYAGAVVVEGRLAGLSRYEGSGAAA